MGWSARERALVGGGVARRPTLPLRRVAAEQLRGATTLEQQTLPLALVASFVALATIQLILTW